MGKQSRAIRASRRILLAEWAASMEKHWAAAMDEIASAAEASLKADLEAATPRQAVHDAVFSMARQAGFSINAARAYGELWAERYQTRSERLGDGRDAFQLFGDSVGGIRQALPGSLETYRRGDGLDVLVNAMRTGGREMKPEGQSLIDRIVEGGGVEDPGGDIKSMGGDRIVKGGMFGRKRKSLIRDRPEGADLLELTHSEQFPDARRLGAAALWEKRDISRTRWSVRRSTICSTRSAKGWRIAIPIRMGAPR